MKVEKVERTKKLVEYDKVMANRYGIFCGIDEAGRGPLCGPVVVASCIMPLDDDKIVFGIDDSKKLTEKMREDLYEKIIETSIDYQIATIDEKVIDEINILEATKLGMKKCIEGLKVKPKFALVDAVKNIDTDLMQIAIIHGDATSYSIAAASILAKVYRDRLMKQYDEEFPEYHFAKHKGYGTKEHIELLKKYGPSKIHRKTFIKNFVEIK